VGIFFATAKINKFNTEHEGDPRIFGECKVIARYNPLESTHLIDGCILLSTHECIKFVIYDFDNPDCSVQVSTDMTKL
jgi:hypothetical protein